MTPPSKEEERKRRVVEAEKKRAEEAKRKELYDLMKVNRRSMKNGRCFAHDSLSPRFFPLITNFEKGVGARN